MCLHGTIVPPTDSARDLHAGHAAPVTAKLAASELKQRKVAAVDGVSNAGTGQTSFSRAEVAKHNTKEDAWIIVKDRVYNVTDFAGSHPGGRVIYEFAGRDATDVFSAFHSAHAWSLLRKFAVGRLQDPEQEGTVIADFRDLKAQFTREGLFKSSKLYYVWKTLSTVSIVLAAIALLYLAPGSFPAIVLSAALMGLGLQQGGWLSHDFCHNQVFNNRAATFVMQYATGNLLQGFSVYWWKHKHNTHHALPNQITAEGAEAVDPDIDTLPFLAWSVEQLQAAKARGDNFLGLLKYQDWLMWPLLLFARMSWCEQSVECAFKAAKESTVMGVVEIGLLAVHYAWLVGSAVGALGLWSGLGYVVLAEMFGGLFLGYVFVQSHNGMEVYADDKDFCTAQLVSTRDVEPSLWNDWFTGGLNYQIEHHLFPKMPRHNLHATASRVKALCEKHGIPYESMSMGEAMRRVSSHLAQIAKHV